MNKKPKSFLSKIKNRIKVEEYWSRPAPYVQPKITHISSEELSVEKYINTVASHEFIDGGRQVPNRKPKY
jgi:hypothetical protein